MIFTKSEILWVHFSVQRGDFHFSIDEEFSQGITGIYGPSGSGKTTFLRVLAGLETPMEGKVQLGERVLFEKRGNEKVTVNVPPEKRKIGYVFQEGRLFPHLSIQENLCYGMQKNAGSELFDEVVEILELRPLLKSYPAECSGGEKQRVAMGRALLNSPELLIFDEPFSALDSELRLQILPYLMKLHKRFKTPMLVVSHDLPDLLRLTTQLCLMKRGGVLAKGDYYELLKNQSGREVLGRSGFLNVLPLEFRKVRSDALSVFRDPVSEVRVYGKVTKTGNSFREDQSVRIFIQGDDIALSKEQIMGVTIQNQLRGRVQQVTEQKNEILCLVDVGFPLCVEITQKAQQDLDIVVGAEFWCVFKSVAVDWFEF